jgi:phenylalanyl-tRNA synthetase beta chain
VKILVSWLRDFVDVPVPIKDLAWDLNLRGFEVASVDPVASAPGEPEDAVIDFEITANRPDCLSVLGMAREVATCYGQPLRHVAPPALAGREGDLDGLRVVIEDPVRCPRYTAALADVRLAPSPAWMVRRLEASGVRAISNVVDITNYVLLETGHPLHAFDLERLGGAELRIRCAAPAERMTTLDGQLRELDAEMLVIADATRPQAVAGVMGGGHSEVHAGTRTIAIESAYFQPVSVRRTSKRLGLSTEASYRFERGADIDAPLRALARTCELLVQTGAGTPRPGWVDAYPGRRAATEIVLQVPGVGRFLGRDVSPADVERILRGLGFEVGREGDAWRVRVPSWRSEVALDVDLYEEIARHDGYDKLPLTFPALVEAPPPLEPRLRIERTAKRLAARAGFNESVNFTFLERAAAAPFADDRDLVAVANPLSEKFAVLRPSLLPGLVDSLGHNRRRERRDVQVYESGTRFTHSGGESRGIGLAWMGAASPEHWSGSGRAADFYDMKAAVEAVAAGLGLAPLRFTVATRAWAVPGRTADVALEAAAGLVRLGVLAQLSPAVAEARGLPAGEPVFLAELDLDAARPHVRLGDDITVTPLPRHPSVVRDLSILVDERLPAATLRDTIRAAAPVTLIDVREFARYQGKGVPEGQVSLSFRLTFRAADRTLTDEEVQQAVDAVLAALAGSHGARLR